MSVKLLRLNKNWSQEQLAHLSGLNVRTIQRIEKGENVGLETLKSLAAVFEISTEQLIQVIQDGKRSAHLDQSESSKGDDLKRKAQEKVKAIKQFYISSGFLLLTFLLFFLPNYNGGENLGPLIVGFLSFAVLIVIHGCFVFQPFGEDWERRKISKMMRDNNQTDDTEFKP